jgi:hypothetical protein
MNPSSSASIFRSCHTSRGNSKDQMPYWQWRGICNVCARTIHAPRDLFCENFGASRGSFPICQNAWCSECYREMDIIRFPRQLPENDEGALWRKKKDEERFLSSRKGDMLCAPFQCDFCWFINLKGRMCNERRADDRLNLSLIRRVNLDILWDKEPSMVNSMLQVFVRANSAAQHLGIRPSFMTCKRPWPLSDTVGFGEAMLLLWDSVQKKQTDGGLRKFDTVRKLRSMSANVQLASYAGGLEGLGFREGGLSYSLEHCSTSSVLFTKFMRGCEKRMGRVVRQDAALSIPVLLAVLNQLEDEYKNSGVSVHRKRDIVILGHVYGREELGTTNMLISGASR